MARLAEIERNHFWFEGRRLLVCASVRRYLPQDASLVVDIGCGTGQTLAQLRAHGLLALGLDRRSEGLALLKHEQVAQASALHLPLPAEAATGVLMLDVLEHVDDEVALKEVHRVLRPNGVLIATVPAVPWLWSYRDEGAGHIRRYTASVLRTRLADAGLTIIDLLHYQFFLFPLVVVSRWIGRSLPRLRDIEDSRLPLLNSFFAAINRQEARGSIRGVRWPWGSSIVAIARKAAAPA